MQRVRTLALGLSLIGTSALSLPAAANSPLGLTPDPIETIDATAELQAPPLRYAQMQGNMGGGLIEALFGGQSDAPQARGPIYPRRYGDPAYPRYEVEPMPRYGRPSYARGEPAEDSAPYRPAMNSKYLRQVVDYDGKESAGTIIIDTPNRFLYLVQDGGKALRYGIGVGRPGFTWAGMKTVSQKCEWPDWRPPDEMLKRRPDLPRYMPGGPENPLGARALYLGSSLYRIHGSNEPWTIGTAVSSGCIRMRNEDVIDLYERVSVGTRVLVI